jgi:hypothetical protein
MNISTSNIIAFILDNINSYALTVPKTMRSLQVKRILSHEHGEAMGGISGVAMVQNQQITPAIKALADPLSNSHIR